MSSLYPEVHLVLGGVRDGVAGEQNLVGEWAGMTSPIGIVLSTWGLVSSMARRALPRVWFSLWNTNVLKVQDFN